MKTAIAWVALIVGTLCVLFGLWAIGAYVWGVIDVLDAADQSWIFWGLAILFIGIFSTLGGGARLFLGRRLLNRSKDS